MSKLLASAVLAKTAPRGASPLANDSPKACESFYFRITARATLVQPSYSSVWEYTTLGYQVLKKWLSYRDARVLKRPLTNEEAREF